VKNRAAERARQEIRRAWRDAARANATLLLGGAAVAIVVGFAFFLQPLPLWVRTFELGALFAASLAAMAWIVHIASGMHGRHLGRVGEVSTGTTVVNWRRRRRGWSLTHGLYFEHHGDVDHVLVGPGGVFVLESKWVSAPCHLENGEVKGVAEREPVAQARCGARKVDLLLRYGRSRLDVEVRSVVIMWGPGAPPLPDGWIDVAGVTVCEGRRSRKWLPRLDERHLEPEIADRAESVLRAQLDRQVERQAS